MQVLQHKSPIFVQRAIEHDKVKDQILGIISTYKVFGCSGVNEDIANTDFYLARNFKEHRLAQYWDLIFPSVENHYNEIIKITGQGKWWIDNYWFQSYNPNGFHNWHVHDACMFSNVYYLSLPEGASKTSFWYFGEEFEVEVQEGDIITFPGFLPHCSKPNKAATAKHVIAFNSNVCGVITKTS
jgi:hypothetical protein